MRRFSRKGLDWPSGPRRPLLGPHRRLISRCLLVAAIFLVLLAVKDGRGPVGAKVRDTLAYTLTTEWDYQLALDRVVNFGLQTVAVDVPFLTGPPHRAAEEVMGPAGGQSGTSGDALPMPVAGRLAKEYGWVVDPLDNLERFHPGIYIAAAAGSPVRAVMPGTVKMVGNDSTYGPYVLVDHDNDVFTLYASLAELLVSEGDRVTVGQVLGAVGAKGGPGDEPGLHFELREQGKLIDPLTRLSQ